MNANDLQAIDADILEFMRSLRADRNDASRAGIYVFSVSSKQGFSGADNPGFAVRTAM